MTKKPLSIDDIGHPSNLYEDLPVLTREEALNVLARKLYDRALLSWGHEETNRRLTVDDRVIGAVYTTLELLQNGVEGEIPSFQLVPTLPLDPNEIEPKVYVERHESEVRCHWPEGPIPLAPSAAHPVGMTSVFCNMYDQYKDRLAASARDLFRYGEDID